MATKKKKKTGKTGKAQIQKKEEVNPLPRRRLLVKTLLPGPRKLNILIFFLSIAATVFLYAGDLHLGFFRIDDPQYVENNPWIRSISGENIKYILSHPYFANYSPVHLFTYMLDYAIGGKDPFVFHLSNNIWAGIVAGFVYLVALAISQNRLIAIGAAVLFIVHPVHVEAVAWISSRKDLLATTFILPSFLTYLYYRQNSTTGKRWYFLSLILFLLAAGSKLSVVVFPAILVIYDLFIEKRNFVRSLIDKIPFLAIGIILALAVANAQPETGGHTDVVILSKSFLESLWLLLGFGEYVIFRVPPVTGGLIFKIVSVLFLLALLFLPLLVIRRHPKWMLLLYWVLITYIPTQVLSFTYPVTDRYLFLPSVAICILVAWGLFLIMQRLKKWKFAVISVFFVIVLIWTINTLQYLSEWKDPRSVWYGALKKSKDTQIYHNLGWQFSSKSASFGSNRRKEPLSFREAERYASLVWKNNPQLPALLNELNTGQHNGPVENEFKKHLQTVAMNYLDLAVMKKEKRVMSDLFLTRGVLYLDMGEVEKAKKEFFISLDEVSRFGFAEGEQEIRVNCHYNIGVAEWTMGNYREALKWIKMAEDEQIRTGGDWIAGISEHRSRLEQIIEITENNK